ncbi:MAG: biotin--[acetyl-CoA-carboxylase] ligase [Synergistaceae bacterium]|nr:biotin--[acetyl-CoA-carboxylase] ligase [Synergistaceae bacterium]
MNNLDFFSGQAEVTVEYHESTPSTQLRARELAREGKLKAIVVAKEQTAARGRLARRWEAPKGSGLYFSILFRPELPPATAHLVNVAAALSVAEAVRSLLGLELRLKWPNDLLLPQASPAEDEGDKKVCGILSESATRNGVIDYCVTGIGLNLYKPPSFPAEVATRAGWLRQTERERIDETELLARIVRNFFRWVDALEREGTAPMLKIYRERCASVSRVLEVETSEETLRGLCLGIGEHGELILETPVGPRRFYVADVVHARLGSG